MIPFLREEKGKTKRCKRTQIITRIELMSPALNEHHFEDIKRVLNNWLCTTQNRDNRGIIEDRVGQAL